QAASIWRRELALREVTLDSPRVRIRREPEGPWNLLALLEHVQSRTATDTNRAPSADTNLFPVTISHLALTNGIVEVADHGVATPFEARAGFRLVAIDLGTRAGARGTIDLAVHGDQAEEIAWGGSIVIQPLAIEGTLVAEGLRPSRAGAYMEGVSPYAITSGVVRLNLTAGFSPSSVSNHPPDVQVRKGLISVQDLAVVHAASRAPFLTAGTIDLENLEAALATQSIALQRLAIRSG